MRALGRLLLLVAWMAGTGLAVAEDDPDGTLLARERDLEDLKQRAEQANAELIAHRAERQALIAELEERERDVAALAIANRELDRMVREQTRVAEELRTRESEERAIRAKELASLSGLLRAAYAIGRADALRLVLNQEDPVRASRVMSYFAYFNRSRVERIRAVEVSTQRLADLARNAEQEAERLQALAAQQESTRGRLEAAKRERAAVLASLERTIATRQDDVALMQRDTENLRLLVEHLRQRAQIRAEIEIRREPFAARRGRLAWPLAEHRILTAFGTPKEYAELPWDGILLAAREGEEVRAVYDGRVVYADWLRGFGLLIVIDHGDGYLSFYGHNQALLKEVGEWVGAGDPVALGGNSGGRSTPVLYFAIRHNGEPLDPATWCG